MKTRIYLFIFSISIIFLSCFTPKNRITDNPKLILKKTGIKFGDPSIEFTITVPNDYNFNTIIDTFVAKYSSTVSIIGAFTDRNFSKSSNNFIPGKKYNIKLVPLNNKETTEECMQYLITKKALFVNAQGLLMLFMNYADKMATSTWIISLDYKDSLFSIKHQNYTEYFIPALGYSKKHHTILEYLYFEENDNWGSDFAHLLVVYEAVETTR